jgi:hypothetical protein
MTLLAGQAPRYQKQCGGKPPLGSVRLDGHKDQDWLEAEQEIKKEEVRR